MGILQFGRKKEVPACFPPGRVGYAVGDIHGRADLLARMFDRLERDVRPTGDASQIVVFLGDYVDRGPDSADVIDLLLTGRPEGFERRFLKGNHEAAMLAFLEDPVANRGWLSHGGLETLASYNVRPLPSLGASGEEVAEAGASLRPRLPVQHRRFLEALERFSPVDQDDFPRGTMYGKCSWKRLSELRAMGLAERENGFYSITGSGKRWLSELRRQA